MASDEGSPRPGQFPSVPGAVYPLYHVFADVGGFADGKFVLDTSSRSLKVDGIVLAQERRRRLVLVNLTEDQQTVQIRGLSGQVQIRHLDAPNAVQAMTEPEAFREQSGDLRRIEDDFTFELGPYAYARLRVDGVDDQ